MKLGSRCAVTTTCFDLRKATTERGATATATAAGGFRCAR